MGTQGQTVGRWPRPRAAGRVGYGQPPLGGPGRRLAAAVTALARRKAAGREGVLSWRARASGGLVGARSRAMRWQEGFRGLSGLGRAAGGRGRALGRPRDMVM